MSSTTANSERLTAFRLRAVAAPDVLPRCLELLAKRNMVPDYWHAERTSAGLEIEFRVADIDAQLEAYLAECLRRIVNVETVFTSEVGAAARRRA